MFHNNTMLFTILFCFCFCSFTTSTLIQFPQNDNNNGTFELTIIPPTSPDSPFYTELLIANNISVTTAKNLTLNQTHYQTFVQSKRNLSASTSANNSYADVAYNWYASYFVTNLYIGNPPQIMYGIFDTGSDLIWVQCQAMAGKDRFAYFNQTRSLTYRVVDCRDKWRCDLKRGDIGCSRVAENLCAYRAEYLDGDVSEGIMASDVITMKPDLKVTHDFLFGCSYKNPRTVPGIIGASRNFYSMPMQLPNAKKAFSYCITGSSSKKYFVFFGASARLLGKSVKVFQAPKDHHYYLDVIGIQVNEVDLKINPAVFSRRPGPPSGFAIDSGYSVTSLADAAFNVLKAHIEKILWKGTAYAGFELCYLQGNFGTYWPSKRRPKIGIKFRGWVLELAESDLWHTMGNTPLQCLQVIRTPKLTKLSVLGFEQLFDVNVGHDNDAKLLYLLPNAKCPWKK